MKRVLALPIFALAALGAGCARPAEESSFGFPLPSFALKDIGGTTIASDSLKGEVVVINFWATWCPPCREEIPDFVAFYNENRSKGLEIVGFSVDEMTPSEIKPFVEKFKMTYPVVLAERKIIRDFDPGNAIPTTFIVDKRGRIRYKQVGMMDKRTLETWFARLSKE
jgi:cytochrome c biogenesis protein CcmG/thiol:disulfide interchange protein DsbE